jgi:hypothetical protein
MLNINQKDITYPENIPVSASLKALLNSMLQIDQSERIDFEKLKVHDWTTSQNFSLEDAFLMSETLISSKIISMYPLRKLILQHGRTGTFTRVHFANQSHRRPIDSELS